MSGDELLDCHTYQASFFSDGYVVIRQLVSTEVILEIRNDIEAVLRAAFHRAETFCPPDIDIDTIYLILKEKAPELKGRAYDILGQLQSVRQIFSLPTLQQLAKSILRSPAVMDNTQVRIDDPTNDRLLPMHQEVAQMSLMNITVWIPLQDICSREGGGLCVIPRSHNRGFLPHRLFTEPYPYYGVSGTQFGPNEEYRLVLRAGDALLFHPLLIHGSVPNKNDHIRWTLVGRLNGIHTLRYLEDGKRHYPVNRSDQIYQRYNEKFEW